MSKPTGKLLTNRELSMFCDQIAMILNAGISPMEGVTIMLEDALSTEGKEILSVILEHCNQGESFHASVSASGVFPKYALDMIEIGEQSGKLEEVMHALAFHYNREESIAEGIKNAVTYPFMIVGMMLIVILVLIIKVLPIFNEVFIQLGSEMTGFSRGLLNLGTTISNYSLVFAGVFALILIGYVFFAKTKPGKAMFASFCTKFFATRHFYEKIASGRFASGMALTMSAGLDTDASLEMVQRLVDNKTMADKIERCRNLIKEEGASFAEALVTTEIFTSMYARMLTIGYKTGSIDKVLEKIANAYEDEVDTRINSIITVLEPTLVIILSVVVCLILLSVMLPLMGIMSSIG
ncbi:MAG: type II secretion system F family protein [Lachnospiraceae bacterium]|nr:type II secretion system F family protein [Lachnospiraceae bacterium]